MINMGAIVSFGGRVLQTACAFIVADALITGATKVITTVRTKVASGKEAPAKKAGRPKKTATK